MMSIGIYLTECIHGSQKLHSAPAELWERVLGRQDSIAEQVFELCAQVLCSLYSVQLRHYIPNLCSWQLVPFCVHSAHHTGWISVLFLVANTTPFVALLPTESVPLATEAKAYSVWTSLPDGLNVVSKRLLRISCLSSLFLTLLHLPPILFLSLTPSQLHDLFFYNYYYYMYIHT